MGFAGRRDGSRQTLLSPLLLPLLLTASGLLLGPPPGARAAEAPACPDQSPELQRWEPGHDRDLRVHIGRGQGLLLAASATVHSIDISDGGRLVVKDHQEETIVLRTRHILVRQGGGLHAGSARCPFRGNFTILLYGRADEGPAPDPYFGRKFVGVGPGGTLELHGRPKRAWTFLARTLRPGGLQDGSYHFERSWGHRGVVVHVIDPRSGGVLHSARFDTYKSRKESERLAQYLGALPAGCVLSVAVNDEGSRSLEDSARKAMTRLGSKHFLHLGFRHPWSFVTVKGNPASSVEDHVEYHSEQQGGSGRRGPLPAQRLHGDDDPVSMATTLLSP